MTNEIEQAISDLCGHCVYGHGTHACKSAVCSKRICVDALREQAERDKGCEYCKEPLFMHGGAMPCNFCPSCGKRLEAQHE